MKLSSKKGVIMEGFVDLPSSNSEQESAEPEFAELPDLPISSDDENLNLDENLDEVDEIFPLVKNPSETLGGQQVRVRRKRSFPESKYEDFEVVLPKKRSRRPPTANEVLVNAAICNDPEPMFFKEAINGPESKQWKKAVLEEYNALIKKNTWELVDLPPGRKPISVKWVFKRKRDKFTGIRYKARLVARGFLQEKGVDYLETYAPVVKFVSIRLLLAYAVKNDLDIDQTDIDSAYLHGDITEEIYIQQPEGFVDPDNKEKVGRLKKAIYGTKQAGRVWHEKIKKFLLQLEFVQSMYDQCIFYKKSRNGIIITAVFVDDILTFYSHAGLLANFKKALRESFPIKDLGDPDLIFGMRIIRNKEQGWLSLDQSEYIDSVLRKFQMQDCSPSDVPIQKFEVESVTICDLKRLKDLLKFLIRKL